MSKHIPAGYHTLTPYVTVPGAAALIDFVKQVFEATEIERMAHADGTIKHAEVRIGDSVMMISEASAECPSMPSAFYLYVTDADTVYQRALQKGAIALMAPRETFYGNREAGVKDQFGNTWWIATYKEEVSPEEMLVRFAAQQKSTDAGS